MLGLLAIIAIVFQFFAYLAGVEETLGLGTILAMLLGLVVLGILPGIGQIFTMYMAWVGAYTVWGWAWWQALALLFPGVALFGIIMVSTILAGGLTQVNRPTPLRRDK